MANSFGSLYVGASGLQSASHGLNTTSNNLMNVNTEGYVREQVVYEDRNYQKIGRASVSDQYRGLGVDVGTIVHTRDVFLDKAYRQENGRHSFYDASSEAVQEVYTHLQEIDGVAFKDAIANFEEAFEEFAKDPSDTVYQNLVLQRASLFLDRAQKVQKGFEDYQTIINSKITEDLDRINKIGKEMVEYNKKIQTIEAGKVEKAMELRDKRDLLLDELSGLVRMSYEELPSGVVRVQIEGAEFVSEVKYNPIGNLKNQRTGYVTPYWPYLSEIVDKDDPSKNFYYPVFDTTNVSAEQNSDIGEVKALLMARGTGWSNFLGFYDEKGEPLAADAYKKGIANSIMMNSEAELDTLVHKLVTTINDIFSPLTTVKDAYSNAVNAIYKDADGTTVTVDMDTTRILDEVNCSVGSDDELPPRELFIRNSYENRYVKRKVTLTIEDKDNQGNVTGSHVEEKDMWFYNEEDYTNPDTCYSVKTIHINEDLEKQESYIPHLKYLDHKGAVDMALGSALSKIWNATDFNLNPGDTTPCGYTGFYVKWIGEIGNTGNIYKGTAKALEGTKEEIEFSRQGVIGVSSDEELTTMIKYQSAYNAASRYINVVDEMIEHILNTLGNA
ncbi:flagellar hook-associated protein 1 FlgK [Pseudobutyrivibrio sp. ACV-2]|uniref:flagellar hook-associated protein FlgK n=1 Tax=Pseudobutyrivibrio sp. ACV-2 TaxID=1520801 RepID=UPI0008996CEE|nr:flagellar basal body rod C-terminal domain-containing protein [Pseudobutyrivibrio sp. ACV-2]SEA50161.1 flagellar hook-associated protein 1 FlgK [Pseudobutyrivibrio sp. ACV-2]